MKLGKLVSGASQAVAAKHAASKEAGRAELQAALDANAKIVCPHCQTAGGVTPVTGKAKGGISGGKATGALLTGGTSLLFTGLSKKNDVTRLECFNCKMSWLVAA